MFDQSSAVATDTAIETTAPAWLRLHHEMKSETRAQSSWDARRAVHLREAEVHQVWIHFGYHLGAVEGEQTRKKSTLTERKRKRIIARDKHRCAVPGCRSKKWLDVHHIKHREHGGGNADSNLITLCSGHHAAHHAGRLAITGLAPDRVCFDWNRLGEDAHRGTNENQAHAGTKTRQVRTSEAPAVVSRFGATVVLTQARDALVGLGWKPGIARAAVEEAAAAVGLDVPIERLIQEALRRCPRPLG